MREQLSRDCGLHLSQNLVKQLHLAVNQHKAGGLSPAESFLAVFAAIQTFAGCGTSAALLLMPDELHDTLSKQMAGALSKGALAAPAEAAKARASTSTEQGAD